MKSYAERGGIGARVRDGGSIICHRGDGRSSAGGWEELHRGIGGAARRDRWDGAGVWAGQREGMGGAERGHGRGGAGDGRSSARG